MLDHVSLQTSDVERSASFYVRVFAALGVVEAMRVGRPEGTVVGLSGPDGFPHLWLGPLVDAGHRPVHLALAAATTDAVDEVHRAAVDAGAEILHEPRVWTEYHRGYYGVFLRDLDGNNVEAVHHSFP
ncbi:MULTISPECIES: VOC family protein [unclassified Aeromicrobium]|uniref:VOC family protein n=1 Tax=unclassified Aeromicrobium TaxID=2633570 RepID=UPI00288C2810|nr:MULTISPECIES: VOC family protein [unclassified Aeromicrobium]